MSIIKLIIDFLNKHPRINLLQFIFRKIMPSAERCREIVNREKDPYYVHFVYNGSKNKGIPIYVIRIDKSWEHSGFCHLLRMTLLHLAYAERMGFTPIIIWQKGLLYCEEEKVNNTDNGFEYFFENVSDIEYEDSSLVVYSKKYDVYPFISNVRYSVSNEEISYLSNMISTYLRFNDYGYNEIEKKLSPLFDSKKVLGVHVRGTDYNNNYDGHPKGIALAEYIECVKEVFVKNKFDFIFVASDEDLTIKKFKKQFGDLLIVNDVYRSKDGSPVHYGNCDVSKYKLGRDILIDVWSLSKCTGLIAGMSNVSIIARAIKESTHKKYDYLQIIDKGINSNINSFIFKMDGLNV